MGREVLTRNSERDLTSYVGDPDMRTPPSHPIGVQRGSARIAQAAANTFLRKLHRGVRAETSAGIKPGRKSTQRSRERPEIACVWGSTLQIFHGKERATIGIGGFVEPADVIQLGSGTSFTEETFED